ncbi:MAG TPA: hypothetical protein V6D17_17830 [Candidatus Obscuribacterales bacterium]
MSLTESLHHTGGVPEDPDEYSAALAHVVTREGEHETVLGQAWLAAPNKLVTCGHVVEPFISQPERLIVRFPYSGNSYAVEQIILHPSFVRQSDQLVKFDAAALIAELMPPESLTLPLPIAFEKPIRNYQPLSAIRFPVHLGQYTTSPRPLAQLGRMLGELRRHDNFHLLHDLALAPGDSGAPIFDGTTVVAMHCGDTASLPGLNLPTTSIRLALWIDALKDLGVVETYVSKEKAADRNLGLKAAAYVLAGLITFAAAMYFLIQPQVGAWRVKQPQIMPLTVSFDKPANEYHDRDPLAITFRTRSDCYVYLFQVVDDKDVLLLYPFKGSLPWVKAGTPQTIEKLGGMKLAVSRDPAKLHWVLLNFDAKLYNNLEEADPDKTGIVKLSSRELFERIDKLQRKDPDKVLHLVMNGPVATLPGEDTKTAQ